MNVFNKNGTYEVVVSATDGNYETPTESRSLTINLPNIDGDTIPEDPGELADATLLGIDSDNDGVRDDIELWVNSKDELTLLQKEALKEMSKIMQKHIQFRNDKQASIAAKYEEIGYAYCLNNRFGREPASLARNELRIEFYNTKYRLLTWARSESNFGGQIVTLDLDEDGYENYCE